MSHPEEKSQMEVPLAGPSMKRLANEVAGKEKKKKKKRGKKSSKKRKANKDVGQQQQEMSKPAPKKRKANKDVGQQQQEMSKPAPKKIHAKQELRQQKKKASTNKQLVPSFDFFTSLVTEDDLVKLIEYVTIQGTTSPPRCCRVENVKKIKGVIVIQLNEVIKLDSLQNVYTFSSKISSKFQTKMNEMAKIIQLHEIRENPIVSKYGTSKVSLKDCLVTEEEKLLYGIPRKGDIKYSHYIDIKTVDVVSNTSSVFSVDCEMIICAVKGEKPQPKLARVSIVNSTGDAILDEFVRPSFKIINYVTKYSGITKEILDPVTTSLTDVQMKLKSLLPRDSILVGHNIKCDLQALEIIHDHLIDTSLLYARKNNSFSLKFLTKQVLGEDIQMEDQIGHSSSEDALATLKLVKYFIDQGPLKVAELCLDGKRLEVLPCPDNTEEGGSKSFVGQMKEPSKYLVTWDGKSNVTTDTFHCVTFDVKLNDSQTLTEVKQHIRNIYGKINDTLCMILMVKTSDRSALRPARARCLISYKSHQH